MPDDPEPQNGAIDARSQDPDDPPSPRRQLEMSKPRLMRFMVLAAALLCSACGIVYELALIAFGSYLVGNSITQTSLVVSIVLSAMGLGALAIKPLLDKPVVSFVGVELSLGIVGACSVPALYASFAWLDIYTPAVLFFALLIGMLIGAEIPLLMELVQMVRRQDAGHAVADLSAADYAGALVGGVAFPFALLPWLGLMKGAIAVGLLNVVVGTFLAVFVLRSHVSRRTLWTMRAAAVVVLVVLSMVGTSVAQLEVSARQALYDDPVVFAKRSAHQEIVLTSTSALPGTDEDVRLFLNGDLQFSSTDEYRYHEALVHPAMNGSHQNVLVLGGGDGLAVREILRYPDVEHVTLVELDPMMIELAKNNERLSTLNGNAFKSPRVDVRIADAFGWVRNAVDASERYDVIVVDFPDPDTIEIGKLYSTELYGMLARLLAPSGRFAVQAGSPYFAPDAYWCVANTIRAVGIATTTYHVDVPSFGDWGFVLGRADGAKPLLDISDAVDEQLRFIDRDVLRLASVFPKDQGDRPVRPSTLLDPAIVTYQQKGWRQN